MPWDSPLGPLEEVVAACADLDADMGFEVDRVVVELPVELQTHTSADGSVLLAAAPVRQGVETSVMPVLHRIRLGVEVSRDR